MKAIRNRYGEDTPWYESVAEALAAVRAYLDHDYSKLTILEIEFFRSCEKDPKGVRFAAEHAGIFAEETDPLDFNGIIFIYDLGKDFAEGRQILLDLIGPQPITPLALYEVERRLNHER